MLHLTADRLAALADEQPNPIEATHIAACPACYREQQAHLHLRELARFESTRPATPLTTWEGIETAMRQPGRVDFTVAGGRGRMRGALPLVRRLAAAAALLATGIAAGRYSAGASPLAFEVDTVGHSVNAALAVVTDSLRDSLPDFRTAADALDALSRAERQYQLATNFLAAHDADGEPLADSSAVYRKRLAALDEVMAATRTALYEAPHDPVINRYYLATLGAREVTVRQLGTSLPPGQSVSRF